MASEDIAQGQYVIECDICKQPVSFFCRRCGFNLCDPCVPVHLRIKSKTGHDVVDYASRDDDDTSKIKELMETITKENERLQNYKYELKKIIDQTQQRLSSLSKIYQQKKDEVTSLGEEWHRQIDKTVKTLHQELDDMQKEHESLLRKQKRELEEILGKVDEINTATMKLNNSQNVIEMKKLIPMIENQETPSEITQYSFPVFYKGDIDDNYLKSYFGYIENVQERKISLPRLISEDAVISNHKILELPKVVTAIDTGFPASGKYNARLYDIAIIDDNRVWMGGASKTLKLFDFQGNLHDTVTITTHGMYFTVYNKHVIYTTQLSKTVCRVAEDKTIQTMFTTGEWRPFGITSSASDDLLVCLGKDDQSKVVRYSGTGTVLQEIQYDSQDQPLYRDATYITENINGDIIVTDWKKKAVTAVDRLGRFRFSYSGRDNKFDVRVVTSDTAGHVIVTDFRDKIHMLDRDGRFLRYIIPDQGINMPRGVCIVGDGEMFVGEENTGIAKRIKYLE
ncbi:uncharacterized protein LOC130046582 [Ostrea edulis]|uniref:uncharacterized protein LOC130046582 n=1 Tax=Ostrea edulis TaxID=37623 RepID=UPI0024AF80C6|nr:uncharacterized protein LOC130046582 [Ostrea edulis]